ERFSIRVCMAERSGMGKGCRTGPAAADLCQARGRMQDFQPARSSHSFGSHAMRMKAKVGISLVPGEEKIQSIYAAVFARGMGRPPRAAFLHRNRQKSKPQMRFGDWGLGKLNGRVQPRIGLTLRPIFPLSYAWRLRHGWHGLARIKTSAQSA